jgi:hypothetical protein
MKSSMSAIFFLMIGIGIPVPLPAIDFSPLTNQITDIRTELVGAVDGLRAGQTEMHKLYKDGSHGLKPELLDQLSQIIEQTKINGETIKESLAPLKNLPSFVKKVAVRVVRIPDLEPTLTWIIDKPLQAIIDYLQTTYATFNTLGEKIRPGSRESAKLDQHFTNARTKLGKAICRIEKTLAALKDDYVISAECKK